MLNLIEIMTTLSTEYMGVLNHRMFLINAFNKKEKIYSCLFFKLVKQVVIASFYHEAHE